MNKLTMFVIAALAAATVVIGALGVAPSASAATATTKAAATYPHFICVHVLGLLVCWEG